MSTNLRQILIFAVAAAIVALAGCGTAKKVLVGNLAPETVITVSSVSADTLRPVNHLIRLHWFGSDPDGQVVAYELRMRSGGGVATPWTKLDCAAGDCTDSLFTIYSPTQYVVRDTLDVRAIDNQGQRDETPAVQAFSFINRTPTCSFTAGPAPNESTYASATISWNVDDPQGNLSKLSFRVYMDGSATYDSVYTGTSTATYTIPSDRFVQGGQWRSGPRTFFVQAVDDGGQVGPPAGRTWYVRSPGQLATGPVVNMPVTQKGRVLLVDNSFRTAQNNGQVDTLFSNTLLRNLPAGTYSILRLEYNNVFRTPRDLAQTFRQFDSVIWYRGFDTFVATVLTANQDSIAAYLDHGGRFFLEGLNMFEGPGIPATTPPQMLRESFVARYLDCYQQWKFYNPFIGDSSVVWGTRKFDDVAPTTLRSSSMADSIRFNGFPSNLRAFVPKDSTEVAFWAKPGAYSLEPPQAEQMALIMNARQPSGGRFMVVPFPIRDSRVGYTSPARLLAKLIFHSTAGFLAP